MNVGLGVYTLAWLTGWYATMRARPHRMGEGIIHLHRGILGTIAIPTGLVTSVSDAPDHRDRNARRTYLRNVARLDVPGAPALELHLARPVVVTTPWGTSTPSQRLLVSADDPAALRRALEAAAGL
jgi:hypothetical protein